MTSVTEDLLDKLVETIVQTADPERIYLFGSRARGNAPLNSDLDLLIVVKEPFDPLHTKIDEMNRIALELRPFHVPTDVLVYSAGEFEKWSHSLNHVAGRCSREGRMIYARS